MPYPLFHPQRHGDVPGIITAQEFAREFPAESAYVELKQGVSPSRVQEVAVGFSNADGGVLIAGVSPEGRVVGVPKPGERVRLVHDALRDTRNPGRYEVRELVVDDRVLIVVSIARRHEGFAQTSSGAVLVRRGASNVPLLGVELSRFLARRSFQTFELTPTHIPLDDADPLLLRRLCDAFGWPMDGAPHPRLDEAGMTTTEAGQRVLTVAGALLLLADPAAVGGRPHIDIRRYAADDPDPDRTWLVEGPADLQITKGTADLMTELGVVSAIVGVQRVEMPKIPERVLREALANAVAHRSYEHAGTAVRVDVRPTSVTITSPGELPEPVTLENIRHQQAARNDRLLGALRRLGLAEDLGKGIDRMQDDMAAELLHAPEFADDGAFFSVKLTIGSVVTPRERAWVRRLIQEGKLDPTAAVVVVAVARDGSTTNSSVRSLLGVDSVRARAVLQALVSESILVQRGERGGASYVLAPELALPSGIRHTDIELEQVAMELAHSGPVTNSSLRARTGADRQAALKALRRLVDRGQLVQRGERRGARYELP